MISSYLFAFGLTVLFEVPIVVAAGGRGRRLAIDALLANLMTHPVAWLAVVGGHLSFVPTEALVVAAEAVAYRAVSGFTTPRAIALSSLANGVTILLSLVL